MVLKVAKRGAVPPFIVMDVLREANARAAAGEEVLHLEVGQPGTPAPGPVLAAAHRALEQDLIGYSDAMGRAELRHAIAGHYRHAYGVELDPARVMVTTGSSGGFLVAFLAAFDVGDRVALAAPGYPAYRNILTALGIEPVVLETGPEDNFQPTVAHLEAVEERLDGLILASPSNPAGTMVGREQLAELMAYCKARGLRFISDEIYHGITYEAPAASALAFGEEAGALQRAFGLQQSRLRAGDLGLGGGDRGLELLGLNAIEQVAGLDLRALLEGTLLQKSSDPRADVDPLKGDAAPDELQRAGDLALGHGGDHHGGGRGGGSLRALAAIFITGGKGNQ